MRLTRLEVKSLPGLPDGFVLEPGPGINLVVGPNASGKSSLARAVRSLLWPESLPDAPLYRLALYLAEGDDVLVARRPLDGAVTWTRDGSTTAPLPVPADHLRNRYELGLLDLTSRNVSGDRFAGAVRVQMAGGYDLDIAGATLFPRSQGATTRKLKELQQCQLTCTTFALRFKDLRRRKEELESLQVELANAKKLADEAPDLAAAQQVYPAREAARAAAQALAAFPPALAAFGADDKRLLEETVRQLREAADEAATADSRRIAAENDLSALRVTAAGVMPDPAGLQPHVEALKAAEAARDTAAAAVAGLRATRDAAVVALGGAVTADGAVPDRKAMEDLGRLFVEAESARAHLQAAEALLADPATGGATDSGDVPGAAVDEALAALGAWLAAPTPSPAWPLAVAALGAATALALVATRSGGLPLAPLALAALLAAGGAALAVRALMAQGAARRLGDGARAALVAAGIAEPVVDRAAAARLRDRWLKETARRDLGGGARARLQADRQRAEADLQAALAKAATLREQCGLGAGLDGLGVTADVAHLGRLHEAQASLTSAEAVLADRERQLAVRLADAGAAFAAAGLDRPAGSEAAAGAVQVWRETLARAQALAKVVQDQRELGEAARRRHEGASTTLSQMRDRLELAGDGSQDHLVAQLAEQHAAWLLASRARDEAETTLRLREAAVQPGHRDLTETDLDARRELAEAAAGEADSLQSEIAKIEAEVTAARGSRDYEKALAALDQVRDRLVEDRTQARRSALTEALLTDLRARNAATRRPAVLDRAAALLKDFTQGRCVLDVDGGADVEPAFAVLDTHTGIRQSPAELSDGTCTQLLLAVRLAFIETMERDLALPLFLDEALTTTDDERFTAVAGGLGRMARDQGRQVFYLTSQPRDVEAWRAALAANGLPEPRLLDLAAARRLARAAQPLQLPPAPLPAVPLPQPGPDGLAAWRLAVGVPPFDPRREPAAQHVDWLLLDNAEFLYRLTVARADLVGTALATRDQLVDAHILDAATATEMALRARWLESFCMQWRVGRGRPVTVEHIDASGAISNVMRDRVLAVLEQSGGNAERLSAGLDEVRGLRETAIARLREYLAEQGLTDEHDILEEPALLQRVLADVGRQAAQAETPMPDPALVANCVSRWWRAAQAALAP